MGRQVVIPQRSAHSGAEGGAAADADKKEGAYWSRELVVPSRSRQVSRFWLEKALVLTDGVQLFALMWQLSQPWPWPARWLEATRWVNAFTLDVFSFRATGAAMGSTSQPFSLWGDAQLLALRARVGAGAVERRAGAANGQTLVGQAGQERLFAAQCDVGERSAADNAVPIRARGVGGATASEL